MKLDFYNDTKRNVTASAINSVLRLFFPFLNRTLFLWLLGPQFLGLNGLFNSLLGVLTLAELGFGSAVHASMYKSIAEDNREQVCAYLRFYRGVYRCVGSFILVVGLCLLPFLRKLIHGNIPPGSDLHVLYLIHLANTAASYFFFAYRGSILGAHNRADVMANIQTLISIAQYISVFLILTLTRNYYFYVIMTVAFTIISNLLIFRESRRLYPDIEPRGQLPSELRNKILSDVKSIFLHKIGGVISYKVDDLVISVFLGLTAIAVYGNYYYVVTTVSGLVAVFYASLRGGFGNKIHTESKEENFKLFMKMYRLIQIIILWCAAMMIALYQPFIALWTKKAPLIMVRHILTPLLMVIYFYILQSRQVLLMFKAAALLWKKDRLKPLVAGAINLAININMVVFLPDEYKLDGVIFSTIVTFAFIQMPWETYVVFTDFFNSTQLKRYIRHHAGFAVLTLFLCALTWYSVHLIQIDGIHGLIIKGVVAATVSTLPLLAIFHRDLMALWSNHKKNKNTSENHPMANSIEKTTKHAD